MRSGAGGPELLAGHFLERKEWNAEEDSGTLLEVDSGTLLDVLGPRTKQTLSCRPSHKSSFYYNQHINIEK